MWKTLLGYEVISMRYQFNDSPPKNYSITLGDILTWGGVFLLVTVGVAFALY